MLNNLINTNIPMPNFVAGERPSANKFNAFFNYLNYKLMIVGSAIGDIYGLNSSNLPKNTKLTNYKNNNATLNTVDKDIDIISIANLLGVSSTLNPRLIIDSGSYNVTETIPAGISEYTLKSYYGNGISSATITGYNRVYNVNDLNNSSEYFVSNGIVYFFTNTSSALQITYTVFTTSFRNAFTYNGASFNVIPDPNVFSGNIANSRLTLTLGLDGSYTATLPLLKVQQSNIFDNDIGGSSILGNENANFDIQLKLPKNIREYYADKQNEPIPTNLLILKCYSTKEVFKNASYYYVNETTIKITNLNLTQECINANQFVLITNGTSIINSIDDLNVKFGKHTHDGTFGEGFVSIKSISDIYSNQHSEFKYFKSQGIPMNWMPQYLHRNGWSFNVDQVNDDNVMRGPLVLKEGVALLFSKPLTDNIANSPHIRYINNLLLISSISDISINSTSQKNLFISSKSLLSTIFEKASFVLNNNKKIELDATNALIQHEDKILLKTNEERHSSVTPNTASQQVYENGVNQSYIIGTQTENVNGTTIRPIKKESYVSSNKTREIEKVYATSDASSVVISENNVRASVNERSSLIRSEKNKTIIINCIPTVKSSDLSSSMQRPEYLIPLGELSEANTFGQNALVYDGVAKNYKSAIRLYSMSAYDLNHLLQYQNNLREKLEGKTIPFLAGRYKSIHEYSNLKVALVKRGRALSDLNNVIGNDESRVDDLDIDVNEAIKVLSKVESFHRDKIIPYQKLNHGAAYDTITANERKALAISNKYYEADLVYMPIKQSGIGKTYENLTEDDIDDSVEFRFLELRELNSMIHEFSVTNGSNTAHLLDSQVYRLFGFGGDSNYYHVSQSLNQFARLTKTHWFTESFPIVRIYSSKTNIINIDHAHNVDYLRGLYFETCMQRAPIVQNPIFNRWIGRMLSNRLGHLLYRTQMITAFVDIDHDTLNIDNSYTYEINFSSQLAALDLQSDPDSTYDFGRFVEKQKVDDSTVEDISESPYRGPYKLTLKAYEYFYQQKSSSSSASGLNMKMALEGDTSNDFTAGDRVSYDGPAIKLVVKDVDHYVVNAIPVAMNHDGSGGLLTSILDNSNEFSKGPSELTKTYRVGYKNQTKIQITDAYVSPSQGFTYTSDFNGVFFYNYSSAGLLNNRQVPTNVPTSNLAIMTNHRRLTMNLNSSSLQTTNPDYCQQDTSESKFNTADGQNFAITDQTRRIPWYACLNHRPDLTTEDIYPGNTNISWDSVFLTNTSNLNVKVTVKEEYVLTYDDIETQMNSIVTFKDHLNSGAQTELKRLYIGTIGSININPVNLKKVKVGYVTTSNTLYFKETSHAEKANYVEMNSENGPGVGICVPNRWGAYTDNWTDNNFFSYILGKDSWVKRDVSGRNRYGMINSYLEIRKGYADNYFENLRLENPSSYNLFSFPVNGQTSGDH